MPYISPFLRGELEDGDARPSNPGELNFVITKLVHAYIQRQGESYQAYNDVLGALEGAKMELYRRKVAPYEDTKIEQNGDV